MERTVMELEAGNYDADDSDVKHRYDIQRQLNIQLQEQKRWLEHELEQVSNPEPLLQLAVFLSQTYGFLSDPSCWKNA